jgi:isoquinoline 1-oxidoreductase beta subunit
MDRREFLHATTVVGGAMVVGFWLPGCGRTAPDATQAASVAWPSYIDPTVPEINAWITIAPDDTVTVRIANCEMGTGLFTSNPMMVAEELQCDWRKVRAEFASPNRNAREQAPEWTLKAPGTSASDPAGDGRSPGEKGVYRRMTTSSSGSVREGRYYLQLAGAEARERLLLATATEWGVPVTSLVAKDSVITHAASNRRTTYGAMAGKAAMTPLPDPTTLRVKPPSQFTLIGTEQKNFDVPLKVTGQAPYGIDVRLPNMLYAAAKMCPVWGGDIKSYDFNAIRNRPGVHSAVRLEASGMLSGGVAVVADSWWRAKSALDAMPIEWNYGPNAQVTTADLIKRHLASLDKDMPPETTHGDIQAGMARAVKVFEASYTLPYVAHASLEPANATAMVTADRVDVWTGSQYPDRAHTNAAKAAGISPEKVYVHMLFLGGGYGNANNIGHDSVPPRAVQIAKTLNGRPVKYFCAKEEDWGPGASHRPMSVCVMKAGLDASGYPIAIHVKTAGEHSGDQQTRGFTEFPYYVPHYRYDARVNQYHVPVDTRRATGSSVNCFYLESFIDELAHAAGKDPYLYRRELISRNPVGKPGVGGFKYREDWLKALDAVAKMSEWGKPLPAGWGRGIAIDDRRRMSRDNVTLCAEVHTISVSRRGQIKLERADVVFDTGFTLINPLSVRKQIEGQMNWGYDDAVHQEVTIKDGRAVEVNVDTYPISRMNEYPRTVNIEFMKTARWQYGAGEEAIQQVAPAIANAVFKVTGKRIRSLPLKNHDMSWG